MTDKRQRGLRNQPRARHRLPPHARPYVRRKRENRTHWWAIVCSERANYTRCETRARSDATDGCATECGGTVVLWNDTKLAIDTEANANSLQLSHTISLPPPPPLLITKHITRTRHLHRPLHSSLPLPTQKHMNKSITRHRHRPLPNHLHRPVPVPPNHKLTSGLGPKIPPCDFESGCQGPTPGPGKAPGPGQAPHPEESRIEPAAAHGRASYGGYLYEVLAFPIARLGGN